MPSPPRPVTEIVPEREAAAKAAYECFGFQQGYRWEDAEPHVKWEWRGLAEAAIRAYISKTMELYAQPSRITPAHA